VIIDARTIRDGRTLPADLVVIGAGPAGIVTAMEVAKRGFDVLVIESGKEAFSPEIQRLADAAAWDPDLHPPMSIATRRQVGGTSVIWGGRCVPYDPIDFETRPVSDAVWPVGYQDLIPFFQRASDWLVCGRSVFDATQIESLPDSIVPGLGDEEVRTSTLERWSLPTDFGREYRVQLRRSRRVRLVMGLTCTEIVCSPGGVSVDRVECRTLDRRQIRARGRRYVVACGGLEGTRLLLASRSHHRDGIGNHSSHLGRWYMGHVEGVIANVHFSTPPRTTIFGYERDIDGVYVRRRFSFTKEFLRQRRLPNVVAWLANPELADPVHRSGILSFVYLALSSPLGKRFAPDAQRLSLTGESVPGSPYGGVQRGPIREHLTNVIHDLGPTVDFAIRFGAKRFLARRRRAPGFFIYSPHNTYPLQYHGEHLPNPESTVSLTQDQDAVGMPKLRIDLRFSDRDVDGIVRAHRYWDSFLRRTGKGHLEYRYLDLQEAVWDRIGGGFHQVGTTRMSSHPNDGVVDANLAVHGFEDLYVASSSTFVSSSQANSTFMIVVFSVRLADHLVSSLRRAT
jgi:choline dehydrogenase-like flavoprotein